MLSLAIAVGLGPLAYEGAVKGQAGIFWILTFLYDCPASWVFVGVMLFALLAAKHPLPSPTRDWIAWTERHLWVICAGVFLALMCALFAITGFAALSMDEYSVLLQSRIFAAGHLSGHLPPEVLERAVPFAFRGWFVHVALARGEWASTYWPGCALLMAPFAALGAPWAFNPAITALSVGAMWRVSRRLFALNLGQGDEGNSPGEERARLGAAWATLLFVCSPVVVLNAVTYYTMPAHLLFNLLFCGALLLGNRKGALLAGILGGYALCLHNPAPHALFALPFLVWMARHRRDLLWPTLAGYLVFFPPLFFGWSHFLHGFDVPVAQLPLSALPSGVHLSANKPLAWPSYYIFLARVLGLCKLWLWAVPALLVLAFQGWRLHRAAPHSDSAAETRPNPRPIPVLRLSSYALALTFFVYCFVPFDQGHGWGFRYLHQLYFVFPWLAARFLVDERAQQMPQIGMQTAWLCALSAVVLLPMRGWQAHDWIAAHRAQIIEPPPGVAGIVFIHTSRGLYTSDLVQNDPFGRGGVWYLQSRTPREDAALARRYLRGARVLQANETSITWIGSALSTTPLSSSGR